MKLQLKTMGAEALVRRLAAAPGILHDEVDRALQRGAMEVAREAKKRAPKAFSTLTTSIISNHQYTLKHYVQAGVNYAYGIEHGTKPGHRPSTQSIIDWIKIKGIEPADMSLDSAAFLIARKIYNRGTDAQPFLRPALDNHRSRILQLVRDGERRALKRITSRG